MLPRFFAPAVAVALTFALSACSDRSDSPEHAPPVPDAASAAGSEAPPVDELARAVPRTPQWKPAPVLVPTEAREALRMQAVEAEARGHYYGHDPLGALDLYTALAAAEPPMEGAEEGRQRVIGLIDQRFQAARRAGRLLEAEADAAALAVVRPEDRPALERSVADLRAALAAVERGGSRFEAGQWLAPRGDNAVFHFRAALDLQPALAPAEAGLAAVEQALLERAASAVAAGDFERAEADLRRAARIGSRPEQVQDARAALARVRAERASVAIAEGNAVLERLDLPGAAKWLADAKAADPQAPGIDELGQRLANARRYGHFRAGQRFADRLADGSAGPQMTVVPHGEFRMGAGEGEQGARDNEGPSHRVRFERGFALAVHETTVAEFARFVAATGYRTVAERVGRSSAYDERGGAMVEVRGAHWRRSYLGRTPALPQAPVVHIAFEDAAAYAEWLSARTGQRYRLPSEAEFEYALRAGEAAPWAWGAQRPARAVANLTGEGDESPQGRRWGRAIRGWSDGYWGPAPVGRYPPEGFGTHDLIGNVSEWVEDCWHDSYRRAPGDGRAWVNPGCGERVVRGGSWASTLEQSRSAFRLQVPAGLSSARIGFRVARDL